MLKNFFTLFFISVTILSKAQTDDIKDPDFITPFVFFKSDLNTRETVQKSLEVNSTKVLEGIEVAIIQKELSKFNNYSKELIAKREAISSKIRETNNYYAIFTQTKDIISVRQQISDKQKAKSEYEKKFLEDLKKQTITEGLYFVVLGSDANSLNLSSGQYKEIAQQYLVSQAVKELDGAFISSVTRIVDRKDVQTKVTSKVKGKMTLKDTPFEKRRLLAKDYLMLLDVNVQPLSDTLVSASEGTPIVLQSATNCKNREDLSAIFVQLKLNESDIQLINAKVDEALPLMESVNGANAQTIQELWENLTKNLLDIQQQIESLKLYEKEKVTKISELCKKLFSTPIATKNMNDTISEFEEKLKNMSLKIEQRMELIENKNLFKIENREIKLNSNLSPIEALSEAIERLSKEMESAYASQFAFSEELVMQNKIVQDYSHNKNSYRKKQLNKVWVYLTPTNDESYKLTMFSKFDLIKLEKAIKPEPKNETPIIEKPKPKKSYGFDLARQPDLSHVKDENAYYYDYFGEVKNGLPNGKGEQKYEIGNVYEGFFSDGFREGEGNFTWTNGEKYSGNWHMNKRQGKGINTDAFGNTYSGNFANDKMDGQGRMVWVDGQTYEGEWKEGVMEGLGAYTVPYSLEILNCPKAAKYVGIFKNNQKSGKGKCFNSIGQLIYEGDFILDFPIEIYPNVK